MSSSFYFGTKNGLPIFGNSLFDRCRHLPGRKIVVSFTTKYAVPHQIKPRILKLSIRRKQSNLSTVFILVSRKEKDCYRVVSVEQLSLTAACTASTATVGVKQIILSEFASIFGLEGITKHLMTGPKGNSEFCFPSTLNVPLGFTLGNIEGLRETKLTVPLGASH